MVMKVRNQKGEKHSGVIPWFLCRDQRFDWEDRMKKNNTVILDIYKCPEFTQFRGTFDSVLQDLYSRGVGTSSKLAEVITTDLEDCLWSEGVLGSDTPKKLLDTRLLISS
uniref:Uncharacterized protein n=1 Tax=Amphimedon queenslandica TaxID=400682 RepID=A0A1X7T5Q4_AMPQE